MQERTPPCCCALGLHVVFIPSTVHITASTARFWHKAQHKKYQTPLCPQHRTQCSQHSTAPAPGLHARALWRDGPLCCLRASTPHPPGAALLHQQGATVCEKLVRDFHVAVGPQPNFRSASCLLWPRGARTGAGAFVAVVMALGERCFQGPSGGFRGAKITGKARFGHHRRGAGADPPYGAGKLHRSAVSLRCLQKTPRFWRFPMKPGQAPLFRSKTTQCDYF
jgi:hypothetical protein